MPPKKKASRETIDANVTNNSGNEPKKSTSKVPLKRAQKKRYTIVTPVKQRSLFTLHEKKQFLKALKEEGFSVINSPEILTKYITDRPVSEIRQMIALYTRKSDEQQRKEGEYSADFSPIDSWNSVFQGLLSSTVRKSDYSVSIIPQILDEISEEYTSDKSNCDKSVNYGEIYKYIAQVMRGSYPPELKSTEAATVIALLKETQASLAAITTDAESKFLNEGSWWTSEESDGVQPQPETADGVVESHTVNSTGNELNSSTATNTAHESNPNSNSTKSESIDVYLNLPKIKKISDCMNPLKVPVSLLKDQHQSFSFISSIMESIHSASEPLPAITH